MAHNKPLMGEEAEDLFASNPFGSPPPTQQAPPAPSHPAQPTAAPHAAASDPHAAPEFGSPADFGAAAFPPAAPHPPPAAAAAAHPDHATAAKPASHAGGPAPGGMFGTAFPLRNPFAAAPSPADAEAGRAGPSAPPPAAAPSGLSAFGAALRNPFAAAPPPPHEPGAVAGEPLPTDSAARLRALESREAALLKRESELRAAGAELALKNWPPCYPLIHHDIAGDIPPDMQGAVWLCYASLLGLVACFTWQFVCACGAFALLGAGYSWLWSVIYLITGIPGAFYLWYMRFYHLAKQDGVLGYILWFLFYAMHCSFVIVTFVAPGTSNYAMAGVITTISAYSVNRGLGVIYMIGCAAWATELLLSCYVFAVVYNKFRGRGGHEQVAAASKTGGGFARFM